MRFITFGIHKNVLKDYVSAEPDVNKRVLISVSVARFIDFSLITVKRLHTKQTLFDCVLFWLRDGQLDNTIHQLSICIA